MKKSQLKQIIKEEISKVLSEENEMAGLLNRPNKNKSLKVGDITTIQSGKYKGKKVKKIGRAHV